MNQEQNERSPPNLLRIRVRLSENEELVTWNRSPIKRGEKNGGKQVIIKLTEKKANKGLTIKFGRN